MLFMGFLRSSMLIALGIWIIFDPDATSFDNSYDPYIGLLVIFVGVLVLWSEWVFLGMDK